MIVPLIVVGYIAIGLVVLAGTCWFGDESIRESPIGLKALWVAVWPILLLCLLSDLWNPFA